MGILNTLEGFANQAEQTPNQNAGQNPATQAKVTTGMMQALEEHPGGLSAIVDHLGSNGQPVQQWSTGQQPTATPEQIQQGLGGTGFIENVAAKAGVSPEVAKIAMTTVLPLVIAHFTRGGQQAPPQSGFSSMTSELLGKLL
jgi:uncharacterized protein YidB (DUF937 family)